MVDYEPIAQVRGSPVLRVVAHVEGRRVGELWCFTNEAYDGEPPSRWYFRTEDRSLYGYRNGPLAYNQCQMLIEDYEKTKGAKL